MNGDDEDEGGGGPVIIDPKRAAPGYVNLDAAIVALTNAIPHATHAELASISRALRILRAVEGA